jgi:hypothetical protein
VADRLSALRKNLQMGRSRFATADPETLRVVGGSGWSESRTLVDRRCLLPGQRGAVGLRDTPTVRWAHKGSVAGPPAAAVFGAEVGRHGLNERQAVSGRAVIKRRLGL